MLVTAAGRAEGGSKTGAKAWFQQHRGANSRWTGIYAAVVLAGMFTRNEALAQRAVSDGAIPILVPLVSMTIAVRCLRCTSAPSHIPHGGQPAGVIACPIWLTAECNAVLALCMTLMPICSVFAAEALHCALVLCVCSRLAMNWSSSLVICKLRVLTKLGVFLKTYALGRMLGEIGCCFWYSFRPGDVVQIRSWYERHMWDQEPETPTELTGALQGLVNAVEVWNIHVHCWVGSMLPVAWTAQLHGIR